MPLLYCWCMDKRHHNHPVNPLSKPSSSGDSLFGMALAQAFTGLVYGPGVDLCWEAAEIASAVREDRKPANRNESPFELGAKKSLGGIFACSTVEQSLAEMERAFFRPVLQPDRAFRLQ